MNPAGGRSASSADDDQRTSIQAIILIVVAVGIGVLLLMLGFDDEGGLVASDASTTTTTSGSSSANEPPPIQTTTTAVLTTLPPADVSIVVANASGGSGQAGDAQAALAADGYTEVETANASVTPTSVVYFADGAEGDARAVAAALDIPETAVEPMPDSPPTPLNGATVLVVIGADKI